VEAEVERLRTFEESVSFWYWSDYLHVQVLRRKLSSWWISSISVVYSTLCGTITRISLALFVTRLPR